jgi:hypothetical protein
VTKRLLTSITVSLLVPLVVLVAMGYASPPDPSWIPGLYDAADYDDVVVLITSGSVAAGLATLQDVRPTVIVVVLPVSVDKDSVGITEFLCDGVRAPPIPA